MSDPVFVYSLSTCPWCRKAKEYFADVDLLPDDESDRLADEAYSLSGSRAFPVVKIGGEVIVGYAPERFAVLLETQA